jgi:hypothetical protein
MRDRIAIFIDQSTSTRVLIPTPHHAAAATLAGAACHSLPFLFTSLCEGGENAPDPEVGYRRRSSFCSLRRSAGRGGGSVLGEGRGVGMSARTG